MKTLILTINNVSTLVAFVLASFSQEISNYFNIQISSLDSAYLVIYPFISSLFLPQWLKLKQKNSRLSQITDAGELLATGTTIILPFLAMFFIYMMFQSESTPITNSVNFLINFISIGLLIPAAINQTAQVVGTLSDKRIGMYFTVTLILALVISIDKLREIPFFVREFRFLVFLLLYLIVHFPDYSKAKSNVIE